MRQALPASLVSLILLLTSCAPTNEAGSLVSFNKCIDRGKEQHISNLWARSYCARKYETGVSSDVMGSASYTIGWSKDFLNLSANLFNNMDAIIITSVTVKVTVGTNSETKTFSDLFVNPHDSGEFTWEKPRLQPPDRMKPAEGFTWAFIDVRGLKFDF